MRSKLVQINLVEGYWNMPAQELTEKTVLCAHCEHKGLMKIITVASCEQLYDIGHDADITVYYSFKILECFNCKKFNVIQVTDTNEDIYITGEYDEEMASINPKIEYLYPSYNKIQTLFSVSLVYQEIHEGYKAAQICFKRGLYRQAIQNCRLILEQLCIMFRIDDKKTRSLGDKINHLKEKGIIDEILYKWAKEIKSIGDDAAHPNSSPESLIEFSKEDAEDILEFTHTILKYCLEHRVRFEKLRKRRNKYNESTEQREASIKTYIDSPNNYNTFIQYYTAFYLADLGEENDEIIPILINILIQEPDLRDTAKKYLEKFKHLEKFREQALPKLIEVLNIKDKDKDKNPSLVTAVVQLIAKTEYISELFNLLEKPDLNKKIGIEIIKTLHTSGEKARAIFVKYYNPNSSL